MKRKDISPELWARLEEIRNSMSIEGHEMSDRQLEEVGQDYLASGLPEQLRELKVEADQKELDYAALVNEKLGLGIALVNEDEE